VEKPIEIIPEVPVEKVVAKPSVSNTPAPKPKMSLLDALREKVGTRYNIEEIKESKPLDIVTLTACWNEYTEEFAKNPAKISMTNAFREAKLEIIDEMNFIVIVVPSFHQKLINTEKASVTEKLYEVFNNRAIKFTISVIGGDEDEELNPQFLSSRLRFDRIAEKYPLLSELKERLKMDIDIM